MEEFVGQILIFRCRMAGVHAGTLKSYDESNITIKDSYRLWYWDSGKGKGALHSVATYGLCNKSKIEKAAGDVILNPADVYEILQTSEDFQKSLMEENQWS